MKSSNLVSTAELADHLDDPSWILIDCRFNLNFPEKGENDAQEIHIPGALYAHLDRDLSAPVGNGKRGRHPLPDPETCVQTFSSFGIEAGKQVVVYDDSGGANSGRLWWMLQWLGHENTALLDGGWQQWIQEKRELSYGKETSLSGEFQADTPKPWILEAEQIIDALKN
ncbi:MAG: sulfurtransferase, partial [SAR324 cluster bacterium]|nr:sulfurtransferase [SAR324 cluster bacterium]